MTDRIIVNRIAVFAHHGVYEAEAMLGQRFFISLDVRVNARAAGRSDDVADAVSYVDLTAIASDVATSRRFHLIEALAEAIAESILSRFPAIGSIVVRVDKPSAAVPAIIDGVAVEIERARDG